MQDLLKEDNVPNDNEDLNNSTSALIKELM